MKYLKTFEELSPETYMSAADKLSAMGQEERAQRLREYANSRFFKEFIHRQETDSYFKDAVEGVMKDPEFQEFKKVCEQNPEQFDKLLEHIEELREHIIEQEKEEGIPFSKLPAEEKKQRIMGALKHFGIGVILATLGAGMVALEQHLGFDGALSAMVGGFIASALGFGITQTAVAIAPKKV